MSLNPYIEKIAADWWLKWTADPLAVAYDIITSSGKHVQAGKGKTSAKLGAAKPDPLPQIAAAHAGPYETAKDPDAPPPPPSSALVGVYRGPGNSTGVAAFETWSGAHVALAEDFCDGSSWAGIEAAGFPLDDWKGKGRTLVLGVPPFPPGGSWAEAGAGNYDGHYTKQGQSIKAHGLKAIARYAWEFSKSQPWRIQTVADAANFAKAFRHYALAVRATGADVTFCWNPEWGWQPVNPELAYPGDDVVDYIGVDNYDQTWARNPPFPPDISAIAWNDFLNAQWGGNYFVNFAKQHGKPFCFPEWGLCIRPDGHGLGDDPAFVDRMADFIAEHAAWHVYFDIDRSDARYRISPPSTQFPLGAARYRARFGA